MRDAYGGLASQIVTPILAGGRLAGILSLHQCGETRTWTDAEIARAARAAEQARSLIAPPGRA
jgi:GAF domain-containing protein